MERMQAQKAGVTKNVVKKGFERLSRKGQKQRGILKPCSGSAQRTIDGDKVKATLEVRWKRRECPQRDKVKEKG